MQKFKTTLYMKHFDALHLDEALEQVKRKSAPQYLCKSCHVLLTRANEIVGDDDANLKFQIPSVIKFESWKPHSCLGDCRVCLSPEVDEGRNNTSASSLASSAPKCLIGESTLFSTANRILVLILKLYDSFDSLEEDPVDAAFAFLLAVISEAEARVRQSLAEAWEGYVKSYKKEAKRRKKEKRRSESSKSQANGDVDSNDSGFDVSNFPSRPKKQKQNAPTEFPPPSVSPRPHLEAALSPPVDIKAELMERLEDAAEALIQNQIVPASYFDPFQLLLNQYRLNILRSVDPRFVGLFSRVPVVSLERIDSVPGQTLSSASSLSYASSLSLSSSTSLVQVATNEISADASKMVVTIYPDSSKKNLKKMTKEIWIPKGTAGERLQPLAHPTPVSTAKSSSKSAFKPKRRPLPKSSSKQPPQKSTSKLAKAPQTKTCAICDYTFRLNVVKEILAHKRFCGDWEKIEEELKHNMNKKRAPQPGNCGNYDLEEHEEVVEKLEEEDKNYEDLLKYRGYQQFRGFRKSTTGMKLKVNPKRRRKFDEPVTEEVREEKESALFDEQFMALNADKKDEGEEEEDDEIGDEYDETMIRELGANAVPNNYYPTDEREINSRKSKNGIKGKNKNLANEFYAEKEANLKAEPFNDDANAILTEDDDAILNFEQDLENFENIGDEDYLQVSDMENEVSDLSDWDDEDDEECEDDDDKDPRLAGKSLPRTASSSCATCNKSFVDEKGKLRAGVAKRMAAGNADLVRNHSLRCSKREIKKLLIPCRLCLTMIVANRLCRLKHYRKHHPETILICPVNGCGTRLVDDTSDFQLHIRRNHSQDNPAPVFVSDGLQVFERNALEIEGWSDDMKGASSEIT